MRELSTGRLPAKHRKIGDFERLVFLTLNYLDRQMLAAMKSSVMHDIPDIASEANWGRILGQFKWVYAFPIPGRRISRGPFWATLHDLRKPLCLVGGYIADAPSLGWRWGFDACGIVGMFSALPLLFLLRDARGENGIRRNASSPLDSARALLTNSSFILLVFYFTLPALAGWVVRDWMPAILKTEFHLGQGKAGVSATLYWQLAAIIGALGGGWLADRWMRHSLRGRIHISALGMAMIIPALFGVGFAPQTGMLWVAILFLILFGIGWGFFDCNNMPILCQITRPELRATG